MVANRYFQRKAAQPDFYKEDLDMLANTLNIKQDAYNTYLGAADELSAINVDRLEQDNAEANNQIDQYQKQIDSLVEGVGGDYSKLGKDLHNLGRDITKDMSPGGKLYSIATNKANFDKEDAFNKEMLTKGVINLRQYDAWKNNTKSSYTGAVSDREGVYNMLKPEAITKAVNITDFYDKIASKVIPEKFQTGAFKYNPKTGITYENTSSGYERLTQKRLSAILDQAAASDQDWLSYSGQLAGWGDPITQDEINAAKARALNTYGFNHTNYSTNGGFVPEWVAKSSGGIKSDESPKGDYYSLKDLGKTGKNSALPKTSEYVGAVDGTINKMASDAADRVTTETLGKRPSKLQEQKFLDFWGGRFSSPGGWEDAKEAWKTLGTDNVTPMLDANGSEKDREWLDTWKKNNKKFKEKFKNGIDAVTLLQTQKELGDNIPEVMINSIDQIQQWVQVTNPNIDINSNIGREKVFKAYDDMQVDTEYDNILGGDLAPRQLKYLKESYVNTGDVLNHEMVVMGAGQNASEPMTAMEALEKAGYKGRNFKTKEDFKALLTDKNTTVTSTTLGESGISGMGISINLPNGNTIIAKLPKLSTSRDFKDIQKVYKTGVANPNSSESITVSNTNILGGIPFKTIKVTETTDQFGNPLPKPRLFNPVVVAEDTKVPVEYLVKKDIYSTTQLQTLLDSKQIKIDPSSDNSDVVIFPKGFMVAESLKEISSSMYSKNLFPMDDSYITREDAKANYGN